MRNFYQLFTSLLILSTLSLTGCSKDEPTPEPEPEIITYSATYTVSEISDDFFALGTFTATYIDKDGKEQVVNIGKAQMPFTVTVKDLKEDSKLYFDLKYGLSTDAELTKEKYTFKRDASLTIKGSNGDMHSSTIKNESLTMGKDKVKAYLDRVTQEKTFESTVKQLIPEK